MNAQAHAMHTGHGDPPPEGTVAAAAVPAVALDGSRGVPVWVQARHHAITKIITEDDAAGSADRDSVDRIRTALLGSLRSWPRGVLELYATKDPEGLGDRVRFGPELDLAAGVAVAAVSGQADHTAVGHATLIGGLSMTGTVTRTAGVTQLVRVAPTYRTVVAAADRPVCDALADTHADTDRLRICGSLNEALHAIEYNGQWRTTPTREAVQDAEAEYRAALGNPIRPDARRPVPVNGATPLLPYDVELAAQAAAAGGHHLLVVGDEHLVSAAAHRIAALRPDLDYETAKRTTRLHSAAHVPIPANGPLQRPPLVAPDDFAGGHALRPTSRGRPGALNVANGGILVITDVTRAGSAMLAACTEAASTGHVRPPSPPDAKGVPADVTLVLGSRPCPCGTSDGCICSASDIARHSRSAGDVPAGMRVRSDGPDADSARAHDLRSAAHRNVQRASALIARGITPEMGQAAQAALNDAIEAGRLTSGQASTVTEVARTVAALEGHEAEIGAEDMAAALQITAPAVPLFATPELRSVAAGAIAQVDQIDGIDKQPADISLA